LMLSLPTAVLPTGVISVKVALVDRFYSV
jgi:hypothetical protein